MRASDRPAPSPRMASVNRERTDRADRLGRGSIVSLLLTFSAPAIVGMVAQALYNIVDRIFVGQAVGPLGIAGTTLAFPFMLIQMAFSMLIGFGAAALVSLRLGSRRQEEAEQVVGHAVLLLLLASALLTAGGLWLLDPLLRLVGSSEQSHVFAREYLQVIVAGTVFQCVGFGLNAVIRGEGNPHVAMLSMLIGALLNTLLDPLFLFVLGWGVRGAALATVFSQIVSAVWVVGYFLGGRSLLKIRLHHLRLQRRIWMDILSIGSPMFAMQLAASVMNSILNNQLKAHGGDLAISVMGIVHSVALFIAMPIFGLNQGAQPIIGYNYGARKYQRVLRTLELAVLFATLVCLAGFLVIMLAPTQVIMLFNRSDPQLRELGPRALRLCLVMFPIVGFQIVGSSYFQAVGKPRHALLLGLSRQVLLLIPAILILPIWLGLDGIWLAIPTADFCSAAVTGVWLYAELQRLREWHRS